MITPQQKKTERRADSEHLPRYRFSPNLSLRPSVRLVPGRVRACIHSLQCPMSNSMLMPAAMSVSSGIKTPNRTRSLSAKAIFVVSFSSCKKNPTKNQIHTKLNPHTHKNQIYLALFVSHLREDQTFWKVLLYRKIQMPGCCFLQIFFCVPALKGDNCITYVSVFLITTPRWELYYYALAVGV